MWRGLILAKALEQFLVDVQLGRPRLPADRHAARHRRHPDGAVAPAAAGRDARRHDAGEGRAEGRGARRRHGAPLVPEGARRRREHDASSSRPTASRHAIFGAGGGRRLAALTGAPLVGAVPIEPAVSEGGDAGKPVVLERPTTASALGVHRDRRSDRHRAAAAGRDGRLHRAHLRAREKLGVTREQRTVFGEVAEQYERTRPGVSRWAVRRGDASSAISMPVIARSRSVRVRARRRVGSSRAVSTCTRSNRAPGMADVLRQSYPSVIETTFEDWTARARPRSGCSTPRSRGTGSGTTPPRDTAAADALPRRRNDRVVLEPPAASSTARSAPTSRRCIATSRRRSSR